MKRREFLKTTACTGAALSLEPLMGNLSFGQQGKSSVIVAYDQQCFVKNATVASRVQDMVDNTIMSITGTTPKSAAYEALFPTPVTSSTKILIKYNESSGGYSLSLSAVKQALITGLTSMLNGTFPSGNISTYGNGGSNPGTISFATDVGNSATKGPKFSMSSTQFQTVDAFMDFDYFINLAVCWAVGSNTAGVTLTMKNMMGTLMPYGSLSNIHPNFTNSNAPSLSILNSQPLYKSKQVLAMIDAISICSHNGPFTPADGAAYSIVASRDMVAADYQGLAILKQNGLSSDRVAVARSVLDNGAISSYGLGTDNPSDIEVTTISPPWTTGVVTTGRKSTDLGLAPVVEQIDGRGHISFQLRNYSAGGSVGLTIYAPNGMRVWSGNKLEWNGETYAGRRASPGAYLYAIRAGEEILKGKLFWS